MDVLPLSKLAEFAQSHVSLGESEISISRVSTDSRTLQSGDLFVALRGENFDGHAFIDKAVERGAAGAIVDRNWTGKAPSDFALLSVDDTLVAYQQIAARYRESLSLKVVAITGSNGKTTTKDFVAAVLGTRFRVTKTEGNFNNHVGLPRTILEATSKDEIGVWELGMNHPGEIAALARIATPDIGIITNIGVAHIEFMGSREAIAWEKSALAEALGADGTLILNADDSFSAEIARRTRAKIVFAGTKEGSLRATDLRQSASGSEFTVLEGAHRCRAQLPVPGLHMIQNALLAVAAGRAFGLSIEDCAAGLASAPLTKARLQIKTIRGVQFIDDSYNANPESMRAALATLAELETDGHRFAVLGEMAELGGESERGHREVGEAAATLKIDELIAIGQTAATIADAARDAGLENARSVGSVSEAAEILAGETSPNDLVLIKGSRAARTERVLEEFARRQSAEGIAS